MSICLVSVLSQPTSQDVAMNQAYLSSAYSSPSREMAVSARSSVVVDLVALDTSAIAVGSLVVVQSLVFGVVIEDVSPLSSLVTATGSIVKI